MTLDEFLDTLGLRFRAWLHGDEQPPSASSLREQADRLKKDLRRRYPLLVRYRAVIDGFRHRVAEGEKRVRMLSERVEVYLHVNDRANAYHHALELEQTRRTLDRERAQLARHEQAYQDHLTDVDRIKRRLADIQETMNLHGQRTV